MISEQGQSYLTVPWQVPGVKAYFTLRGLGASYGAYQGLNLATHVGDVPAHVESNRLRLVHDLSLPEAPAWLRQVHGVETIEAIHAPLPLPADAVWTKETGRVCAVMVADCLPVLLADEQGEAVAAVHAGWRGLVSGVLERTIKELRAVLPAGRELLAYLGPCIGPQVFEVGAEVRQAFVSVHESDEAAFHGRSNGRYLADLPLLARWRLQRAGISKFSAHAYCTYTNREQFYSYRRDGECGRMAALIWRQ